MGRTLGQRTKAAWGEKADGTASAREAPDAKQGDPGRSGDRAGNSHGTGEGHGAPLANGVAGGKGAYHTSPSSFSKSARRMALVAARGNRRPNVPAPFAARPG